MSRRQPDIGFSADQTTRFVPSIVAVMVFLAALASAATVVVAHAIDDWDTTLAGHLTVQLPHDTLAPTRDSATTLLRATPGVVSATPIVAATALALLEPWLGKLGYDADLPIPHLIDIRLATGARLDTDRLGERLATIVAGANIDDHRIWLAALIDLARMIEAVAFAVLALIGGAAVATVVFATRSGLAVHAPVIELLHVIGAHDRYVANQFRRHALRLGGLGSLFGIAGAAIVLTAVGWIARDIDPALLPTLALRPAGWIVIAAVPVLATTIAATTAYVTVMRALARLP